MKHFFAYRLICGVNGKSYIGVSSSPFNRLKQHRSAARHGKDNFLYRAMRKHGVDAFHMEILYGSADRNHVFNEMESYFIRHYETSSPEKGYNLTLGGDGGNTVQLLTEDQKRARAEKISKALTGKVRTSEHAKAISEALKDRGLGGTKPGTMSEAGKSAIGAAAKKRMTGRVVSETTREKLRTNATGVKFTEERKAAISQSKKGKAAWNKGKPGSLASEETRRKMSEAHIGKYTGWNEKNIGKKRSEETRRKISEALKGKSSPLQGRSFSDERCKAQSEAIRLWHAQRKITQS